jgi:hypothetical protein
MRILITFLLLLAVTVGNAFAQPLKSSLSGSIILQEEPLQETTSLSIVDFKYTPQSQSSGGLMNSVRTKPGVALLSSAIIPGSGQAINGKWGRAAAYFLAEAVGVVYYFEREATARRNEDSYIKYANENWSVLAYAQWLVAYSEANGISNGYEQLAQEIEGLSPDFQNTTNDWYKVNLRTIRDIEIQTPFYYDNGVIASEFSHVVQDYGSQQYYELMSKYYQFLPGWQDFHSLNQNLYGDPAANSDQFQYPWNPSMLTPNFIEGKDRAEEFNNNYRQAGNILKLLVVNHVISAFDAYFTVKLKNSRIETTANVMSLNNTVSVHWHF